MQGSCAGMQMKKANQAGMGSTMGAKTRSLKYTQEDGNPRRNRPAGWILYKEVMPLNSNREIHQAGA